MQQNADVQVTKFLRTYRSIFSEKDFERVLSRIGIKAERGECEDYLCTNGYTFALKGNLYITRAGVFTGRYFSFKPTRYEFEHGVFIPGDRCIPFVDPEVLPSELVFRFHGEILPKTEIEIDSSSAMDLFMLYGEEFASQYIAADPINADIDLIKDNFELPPTVKLTAFSTDILKKVCGFKLGDRILCCVTDWDDGIVDVNVMPGNSSRLQVQEDDMERQTWYENLEKGLLESFDMTGPCNSIEEQLAVVFFDNSDILCIPNCGAVEEMVSLSKRIAYEPFGVESRLWRTGEEVPAIGKWNSYLKNEKEPEEQCGRIESTVPEYIIDSYILDRFYGKNDSTSGLENEIFDQICTFTPAQKKKLLLHINSRHDILARTYNWFADYTTGAVRHRALELYSVVSSMVFQIDLTEEKLDKYPQQALVILSQIYAHVMHILELTEYESASVVRDSDKIFLSLEGMEMNFDDVSEELQCMIESGKQTGFVVIK